MMKYDVVVIGAGPSGLVSTKEMLERGFKNVLCLERSEKIGGTFSRGYDGLFLTSSALFSQFSDFPVKEGEKHYHWTKEEALDYWHRYAQHFGVSERIRFGSEVSDLKQEEDGWIILLANGDRIECDRVVVAIGTNTAPRYPDWAEQLTEIPTYHAKDYKNASGFEGKRVVVVGGGESGSDIGLEISRVAEQCWVSLRGSTGWVTPRIRNGRAADMSTHRGLWKLPRRYGAQVSAAIKQFDGSKDDPVHKALCQLNERVKAEKGIFGTYGTKSMSLPIAMAEHDCKIVDGIEQILDGGRTLITDTGETLENIDAVVFCTGYINKVPYLREEHQVRSPRELYKHVFHPVLRDRLAFVGFARPGFGSQFPLMEMQARYSSHIFKQDLELPESDVMVATAKKDAEGYLSQFEGNTRQITALVDFHTYMDDMASLIGCAPQILRYAFTNPRLWVHVVYGPTQATQFRLAGRGNKFDLARQMILAMPVSRFNHVVKTGLKLQVKELLRRVARRSGRHADAQLGN